MSSSFDSTDASVDTTAWVRQQRERSRGGWIHGAVGSGKTHAVSAAQLGGIYVDVKPGPLLGHRFAADLARQLGSHGKRLLEAVRREGLAAALAVAGEAVNGLPLVVDAAERLLIEPVSLDEPAAVLWQGDRIAIRTWLKDRIEQSPTFVVSRRAVGDEPERHKHDGLPASPFFFREATDRERSWWPLGLRATQNPAALVLAHALVQLISVPEFDALRYEADKAEVSVEQLGHRLGQAFQSSAPKAWQRVLALLVAVGEAPHDAIEAVLGGGADGGADDEAGPRDAGAEDTLIALRRLQQLKLVEDRAGRLSALPALSAFGAIRPLTDQERSGLMPRIAHHLLAPINNIRSLEPEHADRVLLAHSIFVFLGDTGNAERTTALHVHGLVDLARRTSLNDRFADAWQQYDSVLRMLGSGEFAVQDTAGRRLWSYVQHYRAWNGSRAGACDDAVCLDDYQRAVQRWPENALWHQRVIQTLIRLGRLVDARRAVDVAYQHVEAHPRRDLLLRVLPARTALGTQALPLSLALLEPILDLAPGDRPELAEARDAILQRWQQGLGFEELTFSNDRVAIEQRVKLLQPIEIRVRRAASGWVAQARSLSLESRGERPLEAVEALARSLAEEARRLIGTPTSDLGDKDARRKGLLLSFVDALNSEIGLDHARERWIVGRLEDAKLVPTLRHLPDVKIPPALWPETTEGLYFVRVPIHRDGTPSGPADAIKPAGNGFGFRELVAQLERMNEDAA